MSLSSTNSQDEENETHFTLKKCKDDVEKWVSFTNELTVEQVAADGRNCLLLEDIIQETVRLYINSIILKEIAGKFLNENTSS